MIVVDKDDFLEMFNLGILKNDFKNWSITSIKKSSKRKKHYVSEEDYNKYLKRKQKDVLF